MSGHLRPLPRRHHYLLLPRRRLHLRWRCSSTSCWSETPRRTMSPRKTLWHADTMLWETNSPPFSSSSSHPSSRLSFFTIGRIFSRSNTLPHYFHRPPKHHWSHKRRAYEATMPRQFRDIDLYQLTLVSVHTDLAQCLVTISTRSARRPVPLGTYKSRIRCSTTEHASLLFFIRVILSRSTISENEPTLT